MREKRIAAKYEWRKQGYKKMIFPTIYGKILQISSLQGERK